MPHEMRESDEATRAQLQLARSQGEALERALAAMAEEASSGVCTRSAGDYEIGLAVEQAEGMWVPAGRRLEWREPAEENCHVEVCVRDAADGRFLPGLHVVVSMAGPDGRDVGTYVQPFLWHPWLYHYGRNWRVPGEGRYEITVHVDPAPFMRHDHGNGARYTEPVDVRFADVPIVPGRKLVEPAVDTDAAGTPTGGGPGGDSPADLEYQELQGWFNSRGLYLRTEQRAGGWVAIYGDPESEDVQGSGRGGSRLDAARDARRTHASWSQE